MSQKVGQMRVRCPQCEKEFLYNQSSFRPFCSDHCKMIDMGKWLLESYSVPGQVLGQTNEDDTSVEDEKWEH